MLMALLIGCVSTIHRATGAGNVSRVKQILDQNPELANDWEGVISTPLYFAALKGNVVVAEQSAQMQPRSRRLVPKQLCFTHEQ